MSDMKQNKKHKLSRVRSMDWKSALIECRKTKLKKKIYHLLTSNVRLLICKMKNKTKIEVIV